LRRQFRGNTPANAARGSSNKCSCHSETIARPTRDSSRSSRESRGRACRRDRGAARGARPRSRASRAPSSISGRTTTRGERAASPASLRPPRPRAHFEPDPARRLESCVAGGARAVGIEEPRAGASDPALRVRGAFAICVPRRGLSAPGARLQRPRRAPGALVTLVAGGMAPPARSTFLRAASATSRVWSRRNRLHRG
jgi:hypothetical protein